MQVALGERRTVLFVIMPKGDTAEYSEISSSDDEERSQVAARKPLGRIPR
jgi:hypothetical protein